MSFNIDIYLHKNYDWEKQLFCERFTSSHIANKEPERKNDRCRRCGNKPLSVVANTMLLQKTSLEADSLVQSNLTSVRTPKEESLEILKRFNDKVQ